MESSTLPVHIVSTSPLFDYIKCPLHRYTFQVRNIREWTENNCEGRTLNLFAGRTNLPLAFNLRRKEMKLPRKLKKKLLS